MKLFKIPLICLVLLVALTGLVQAQTAEPGKVDQLPGLVLDTKDTVYTNLDCDSLQNSGEAGDSAYVPAMTVQPGRTFLLPLSIKSLHDIAGGYALYVEIDTTILRPDPLGYYLGANNELIYDFALSVPGRFKSTYVDNETGDTVGVSDTVFYGFNLISEYEAPSTDPNKLRMRAWMQFINFGAGQDSLGSSVPIAFDSGSGPVMYVKLTTRDDISLHGTSTAVKFYHQKVVTWVDSTNYPLLDTIQSFCLHNEYSVRDSTGKPHVLGTRGAGYSIYIDTTPQPPVIQSFDITPDTLDNAGDLASLTWSVSGADKVKISNVAPTAYDSLSLSGTAYVNPTAQTTYTLTATNVDGSVNKSVTVYIEGQAPSNNPPVVALNPSVSVVTIEQGGTVSYTVSATDVDGDQISLRPSATLPSNATFGPTNPVVGTGSVSGTFSFTPDINQSGAFVFTFTATDDGDIPATGSVTLTVNVTELEYDRLFTISAEGQSPVGGLAGAKAILFPINLVTSQDVYGVQFDLTYDDELFTIDSIMTTARTEGFVVYDNIGATPGKVRVTTFGMANEIIQTAASSEVLYVALSIDSTATPGDYEFLIDNGWESINPDPTYPSLPLVTSAGIVEVDRPGDVNLDKRIDVADLVNIVGYIIGNFGFTPRQFATANVITDGSINVFDLVGVINIIFEVPVEPGLVAPYEGDKATVELDYSDMIAGASDEMTIHTELPTEIAGVQIEIEYNPDKVSLGNPYKTAEAGQMQLVYKNNTAGKMTVLLHFSNPANAAQLLQRGIADLIGIPIQAKAEFAAGDESAIKLSQALLSTSTSSAVVVDGMDNPLVPSNFTLFQNYPNPFNPTTTLSFSINGGDARHATLDIFNILGQQVTRLLDETVSPGTYEVEWDGTTGAGQPVATGIYLYRLQVGSDSDSKKMLLLK